MIRNRITEPRRTQPRATYQVVRDLLDERRKTEMVDGDTTPTVASPTGLYNVFHACNTTPVTITQFDDVEEGQVFYVVLDGNTVIAHNSHIKLKGSPGALRRRVRTVTADTTMDLSDYMVLVETTAGNVTITLPTADDAWDEDLGVSYEYRVYKITGDGNTLTLEGAGADTIDGLANQATTTQWDGWAPKAYSASAWIDLDR